ncbi:ABC transporter substrate-binding protein [Pseudokineococcus marinus]|uniref:ABC transporter substrate-binding protein n=1 Tax=Pseudokineococcus marinus TaxID=351215 RepID=A0A849BLI6_9ACTN|nr:ABC transporter substrate-binding protein [Pseudokineococcus marinus]NNH22195.1 ABC transporter substrate-binding protein [Pseudokineococcus marinus]
MKRTTLARRSVAVAGIAALALTGCGDDGGTDDGAAPAASGEPSASSSSSDDAAAGSEDCEPETPPEAEGDGVLTIGSVLPQTGNLAFLGPPEFAGVELAVQEINEAGGYNGQDVAYVEGDSGDTNTDIASSTVQRLLSANVDSIIGAASSGVSFTIIDAITGAGVVQISPANTAPDFTCASDSGLYFRTAPSDVLQGRVMGDLVIGDGYLDVGMMAIDDPYGTGLAANVQEAVEAGGGSIAGGDPIIYNPQAPNYSAEVAQLAETNPEAIVLIGFDESLRVIPELISQGIGPSEVPLYLVDGNLANYSDDGLEPGALVGTKGTLPGAASTGDFQERLLAVDPSLTDFSYAPESYDAVVMTALAAIAAGDDSGASIASQLPAVSREGTECSGFVECRDLLEAGEDIDYQGVSGPVEFSDLGDPTEATIGIYSYVEDNSYVNDSYVEGSLD